jgi:hypothetical protein
MQSQAGCKTNPETVMKINKTKMKHYGGFVIVSPYHPNLAIAGEVRILH